MHVVYAPKQFAIHDEAEAKTNLVSTVQYDFRHICLHYMIMTQNWIMYTWVRQKHRGLKLL